MKILFCESCGLRVTPAELQAAIAIQIDEQTVLCPACIPAGGQYVAGCASACEFAAPTQTAWTQISRINPEKKQTLIQVGVATAALVVSEMMRRKRICMFHATKTTSSQYM